MIDILAGQHDYVSFTHGLAFLLVATTARALAGRADRLLAWNWLAASALGAGLSGLLDVLAVALGPLPALPPLRFALMLVACVSLLQC